MAITDTIKTGVLAEKNGLQFMFTCGQWAMFPAGKYGFTVITNNCGNTFESLFTPFAQNTFEAEQSASRTVAPKYGEIIGNQITSQELIFEDILAIPVSGPTLDKLHIYENGNRLHEVQEYTVDLTNQKAVLTFAPIPSAKYVIVYFSTTDI